SRASKAAQVPPSLLPVAHISFCGSTRHTVSNFAGMKVLALESRRGKEMAALITTYGGAPVMAAAMREVALDSDCQATKFIATLVKGGFALLIFLTGVGTRWLADIAGATATREQLASALTRVRVAARGPKPTSALRELGVTAQITAPEPNTWREMLAAIDAAL